MGGHPVWRPVPMTTTTEPEVLDFGGFPGRWEITETAETTDGERFETYWELEELPEGDPFIHTHPNAVERFEVLSGVLEVYADGAWEEVTAGEVHTVEPGTVHSFRNTTPVELVNAHEPALGYEGYFRRFHALVTEEGVGMPPDGFRAAVLVAMLTTEYEDEFRSVSPPQWLLELLTVVGRVLRYRLPE